MPLVVLLYTDHLPRSNHACDIRCVPSSEKIPYVYTTIRPKLVPRGDYFPTPLHCSYSCPCSCLSLRLPIFWCCGLVRSRRGWPWPPTLPISHPVVASRDGLQTGDFPTPDDYSRCGSVLPLCNVQSTRSCKGATTATAERKVCIRTVPRRQAFRKDR